MSPLPWPDLSGRLVVLSGPSGVGKTTVANRLVERSNGKVWRSVSATTRPRRDGEIPGVDYQFVTPPHFHLMRGSMLESFEVHDEWYGTPESPVREAVADGKLALLVLDVQGGLEVRRKVAGALLAFIHPPSMLDLKARLLARGDDESSIERRIRAAGSLAREAMDSYDAHLVNREVELCVEGLIEVIRRKLGVEVA